MHHFYFIKEKFIQAIKGGKKSHEIRLNDEKAKKVSVGDILTLKSKSSNNYINVEVKKILYFSGWEEVINCFFETDFSLIYKNKNQALMQCNTFYDTELVKNCGLIVFEIKMETVFVENISVLIDSNIFISRESPNGADETTNKLFEWFLKKSVKPILHNACVNEIKKYVNEDQKIKECFDLKLNSYIKFGETSCNHFDERFLEIISNFSRDENSKIDNILLYEIYKGAAPILVTNDSVIHKKAELLYISDKVLSSSDYLAYFETNYPNFLNDDAMLVGLTKISTLNINDPFFETLKTDYGEGFKKWFLKKSLQGEEAYVFRKNNELKGFLYLKKEGKDEDNKDIIPFFEPKNRLKIGTFKIDRDASGFRLSERFLKMVFDNAINKKVEEIYVTMYEDKRSEVKNLISFLEKWGFKKWGKKVTTNEIVMIKNLTIYSEDKSIKWNFPNLKPNPNYFYLPIRSDFHDRLFCDLVSRKEQNILYTKNCGYQFALEKVYITRNKCNKCKPGDIVLIYRMGEEFSNKRYTSVFTGIGIIQEIKCCASIDELKKGCNNKTIFKDNELNSLYRDGAKTIIKVIFVKSLNKRVILDSVRNENILGKTDGPRLNAPIDKKTFDKILEMGGTKLYE